MIGVAGLFFKGVQGGDGERCLGRGLVGWVMVNEVRLGMDLGRLVEVGLGWLGKGD